MASEGTLEVVVEELPQAVVVHVSGDLDLASVGELEAGFAASDASGRLVLDLAECSFLDSSVIHVILAEAGRRDSEGGRVDLVAPASPLRRPLEIAQVGALVRMHDSLADALAD